MKSLFLHDFLIALVLTLLIGGMLLYAAFFLAKTTPAIEADSRGERVVDESSYVLFNAHHEPLQFTLPKRDWGDEWVVVLDTARSTPKAEEQRQKAGQEVPVESRSLKVLRRVH